MHIVIPRTLKTMLVILVACLQLVSFITATNNEVTYSESEDEELLAYDAEHVRSLIQKYELDDDAIYYKVKELMGRFSSRTDPDNDDTEDGQEIVKAWQDAGFTILTVRHDLSGKPVFQSGHSFVLWHPELPQFVIKFDKVIERLIGLEKLQEVFSKRKWPVVLPKKYIIEPEEGQWLLLVERFTFLDAEHVHKFLETNDDKFEELKLFLYLVGYCDGNRGNIKILTSEDFGVVDTDDTYFKEPSTLCGATRRLSKYVLGYKDPVCPMMTNTTVNKCE